MMTRLGAKKVREVKAVFKIQILNMLIKYKIKTYHEDVLKKEAKMWVKDLSSLPSFVYSTG